MDPSLILESPFRDQELGLPEQYLVPDLSIPATELDLKDVSQPLVL